MCLLHELFLLLSWEQLWTCICTRLFLVTMGTAFLLANINMCPQKGIFSKLRVAKTCLSLRKGKHYSSLDKWASVVKDHDLCYSLIVMKIRTNLVE